MNRWIWKLSSDELERSHTRRKYSVRLVLTGIANKHFGFCFAGFIHWNETAAETKHDLYEMQIPYSKTHRAIAESKAILEQFTEKCTPCFMARYSVKRYLTIWDKWSFQGWDNKLPTVYMAILSLIWNVCRSCFFFCGIGLIIILDVFLFADIRSISVLDSKAKVSGRVRSCLPIAYTLAKWT